MHMHLQEHIDYDLVESTNPDWGRAVVRINVYRAHRQVGVGAETCIFLPSRQSNVPLYCAAG